MTKLVLALLATFVSLGYIGFLFIGRPSPRIALIGLWIASLILTGLGVALAIMVSMSPAHAWTCRGLVTSNNSCIGSESNVDSWRNHEPWYTYEDAPRRFYHRPRSRRP